MKKKTCVIPIIIAGRHILPRQAPHSSILQPIQYSKYNTIQYDIVQKYSTVWERHEIDRQII